MPQLPTIDNCTACGACVDACNHHAIRIEEDSNGFYNVVLNADKCVDCKQCETKCHILNQEVLRRNNPCEVQPLAGWSTQEEIIKNSATTGALIIKTALTATLLNLNIILSPLN